MYYASSKATRRISTDVIEEKLKISNSTNPLTLSNLGLYWERKSLSKTSGKWKILKIAN